jgi:hypothetical protein
MDNRTRFVTLYKSQTNSRANEVVNSSGANFALPVLEGRRIGGIVQPPADAEPVAGFSQHRAGDGEFRQNGVTTASSVPPSGAKDEKFGPSAGETPGQSPTSTLTLGGTSMNGSITVNGGMFDTGNAADQPAFTERGGGATMSDVQRYAGRLAQQQDQGQGPADTSGSVFDWDKNTWTGKPGEPNRGAQIVGRSAAAAA